MFELLEMLLPEKTIKKLENSAVYCWNNGKKELIRFKKGRLVSFQVPFLMTKIHYPPNKDRSYGICVYVHYIEYRVNQIIQKEKMVVDTIGDYEKIYNRVIFEENYGSEVLRFFKNYQRRGEFRYARESGRYR